MFYKIKYTQLVKNVTNYIPGNEDGDGFAYPQSDSYHESKVHVGTRIELIEIDMRELKSDAYNIYEVFKKASQAFKDAITEFKFKAELNIPEAYLELKSTEKVLATMDVEDNIPYEEYFVHVHHGIRGWYMKDVSRHPDVVALPHRRVEKYGYSADRFKIPLGDGGGTGQERIEALSDAEELLMDILGEDNFDERYAI